MDTDLHPNKIHMFRYIVAILSVIFTIGLATNIDTVLHTNISIVHADDSSDSGSSSSSDDSSDKDTSDMFAEAAKSHATAYADKSYGGDVWSNLGGNLKVGGSSAQNQVTISYASMRKYGDGYADAAAFARQLQASGLDESYGAKNSSDDGIGSTIAHWGGGGIASLALSLGQYTNKLFPFIGDVFQAFNVFAWIDGIVDNSPLAQSGFGQYLNQICNDIKSITWIWAAFVFCVSVGVAIMSSRALEQGATTGSAIFNAAWKLVLRYLVIAFGFSALAVGYGAIASNVKSMCDDVGSVCPSDYIVTSNIVDFKDWAFRSRLSLNSGSGDADLNGKLPNTSAVSASKYTTPIITHQMISGINSNLAGITAGAYDSNSGIMAGFTGNQSYMASMMGGQSQPAPANANKDAQTLLANYRKGKNATINGSTYVSYAISTMKLKNGKFISSSDFEKDGDKYRKAFEAALNVPDKTTKDGDTSSDDSSSSDDSGGDISVLGLSKKDKSNLPSHNGTLTSKGNYLVTTASNSYPVASDRQGGGLSTLGLYVYLNSEITATDITYADASNNASGAVGVAHYSAVIPNSDAVRLLSILQLSILPVVIVLFGILMGMAMLIDIVKFAPKVVVEMPFVLIGNAQAFAKLCTYLVSFASFGFGSIILYDIGCDVIKFMLDLGDSYAGWLNSLPAMNFANAGVVQGSANQSMYFLCQLVVLIGTVAIVFAFLKFRRETLNGILSTVEKSAKRLSKALYGFGLSDLGGNNNSSSNPYVNNGQSNSSNDENNNENNSSNNNNGGDNHSSNKGGDNHGHGDGNKSGSSSPGGRDGSGREGRFGNGADGSGSDKGNGQNNTNNNVKGGNKNDGNKLAGDSPTGIEAPDDTEASNPNINNDNSVTDGTDNANVDDADTGAVTDAQDMGEDGLPSEAGDMLEQTFGGDAVDENNLSDDDVNESTNMDAQEGEDPNDDLASEGLEGDQTAEEMTNAEQVQQGDTNATETQEGSQNIGDDMQNMTENNDVEGMTDNSAEELTNSQQDTAQDTINSTENAENDAGDVSLSQQNAETVQANATQELAKQGFASMRDATAQVANAQRDVVTAMNSQANATGTEANITKGVADVRKETLHAVQRKATKAWGAQPVSNTSILKPEAVGTVTNAQAYRSLQSVHNASRQALTNPSTENLTKLSDQMRQADAIGISKTAYLGSNGGYSSSGLQSIYQSEQDLLNGKFEDDK